MFNDDFFSNHSYLHVMIIIVAVSFVFHHCQQENDSACIFAATWPVSGSSLQWCCWNYEGHRSWRWRSLTYRGKPLSAMKLCAVCWVQQHTELCAWSSIEVCLNGRSEHFHVILANKSFIDMKTRYNCCKEISQMWQCIQLHFCCRGIPLKGCICWLPQHPPNSDLYQVLWPTIAARLGSSAASV